MYCRYLSCKGIGAALCQFDCPVGGNNLSSIFSNLPSLLLQYNYQAVKVKKLDFNLLSFFI